MICEICRKLFGDDDEVPASGDDAMISSSTHENDEALRATETPSETPTLPGVPVETETPSESITEPSEGISETHMLRQTTGTTPCPVSECCPVCQPV